MNQAAITVVIPAYNAEATIIGALESIRRQTLLPRKIVVVDDCSGDSTCKVVTDYIKNLPEADAAKIKLLRREHNRGPASARNCGVDEADTEWIAFLDGDDQWLPDKLAVQMQTAQDAHADMICGTTRPLTSDGVQSRTDSTDADITHTPLPLDEFLYANPVATSTVLLRRSTFLNAGGFDEQFRGPEDYDLWMRIAADSVVVKMNRALSLYRHVPGSLSMDDRTFLPQVIMVMEKAFAPDGVLRNYAIYRKRAYAEKYSSASWMAFNRGSRGAALRLLAKSFITYPRRIHPEEHDPLLRLKLLARYLLPKSASDTADVSHNETAQKRSPRVAHVVISLKHGGLEQCALQWCLDRNRLHPGSTSIICLDEPGPLAEDLPDNVCSALHASRGRFPWDRRAVRRLKELARDNGIDILHSHNTAARQYAALATAAISRRASAPVRHLYTDHSSNLYLHGIINRLRVRLMKKHTSAYTAVSREAAEKLAAAEKTALEKTKIIKNGIAFPDQPPQTPVRETLREQFGLSKHAFVIGYVGRLSPEKGVDRLLKSFADISYPAQLLIIGDGSSRRELEELSDQLDLHDKVVFAGERQNARMLLSAMDLFVLPSRSEGLPLALLEAMAEKVPVAATSAGDCSEVLGNGRFGTLLKDDEATWPATLDTLIKSIQSGDAAEKTEAAFMYVREQYSLEKTIAEYEEIYKKLVA